MEDGTYDCGQLAVAALSAGLVMSRNRLLGSNMMLLFGSLYSQAVSLGFHPMRPDYRRSPPPLATDHSPI